MSVPLRRRRAQGASPPHFIQVMNRYPLWKNILIGLVQFFGLIYTLPNF